MKAKVKHFTTSPQAQEIANHYYQKELEKWYENEYDSDIPPTEPELEWKWTDLHFSPKLVKGPLYLNNDNNIRVVIEDKEYEFQYTEELYNTLADLIDKYEPL